MNDEVLACVDNFTGWAWIGFILHGSNTKILTSSSFHVWTYPDVNIVKVFIYGPFVNSAKSKVWEDVDSHEMRDNLQLYGEPFPDVGSKDTMKLEKSLRAVVWIYLEGEETPLLLLKVTVNN